MSKVILKSVLDYSDVEVSLSCMTVCKNHKLLSPNSEKWEKELYYKQCRKDLAKYRYDSLLKNGKLKSGLTEEQIAFYIKDLQLAEENMFI